MYQQNGLLVDHVNPNVKGRISDSRDKSREPSQSRRHHAGTSSEIEVNTSGV